MIEALSVHRAPIVDALKRIDAQHGAELTTVNRWADDLRTRLLEFTQRGKLIRGSLVATASAALGTRPGPAVYTVAAAVELVQSFLLIHDDIMDEDPVRRGMPAVYEQYRRYGTDHRYEHPQRFGESMAICGGDVAMLLAVTAVTGITADERTRLRLVSLLSREIGLVGVAQMADVANGHAPHGADEEEILSVYRYKTGRYTFSLPLMLGAILAGADAQTVERLSTWGELQGVVFQIRDDHLGIMGETDEIGKPSGSDIAADKQTLHRLHLRSRVKGTRWQDVASYFGEPELTSGQIARVREALEETGTLALLEERIASLRAQARSLLADMDLSDEGRALFDRIDEYNAGRTV